MNILFLTLSRITDASERGIYLDLLRKFRDEGHQVYVVSPAERKFRGVTELVQDQGMSILRIRTLNFQKTNIVEKTIATLLLERQYRLGVLKFFHDIKFDMIMYSTPPITFSKLIQKIKKRSGAKTYLLLKDIFPQNAVDLGMMKQTSLIYRYFRKKEKELYRISDHIGCMSPANLSYLLNHNPQITKSKVEVCPNSIAPRAYKKNSSMRIDFRKKYHIPSDAVVVLYGGNLGKPQGLEFLNVILESNRARRDCFFLIAGSGTEKKKLEDWIQKSNLTNSRIFNMMGKDAYDSLLQASDIGLVMLDKRFTIPNFPSRLLSYLENKMPVLVVTDSNSDMGKIAEQNEFGLFSLHGDLDALNENLNRYINDRDLIVRQGHNGHQFLIEHYTVDQSYAIMMKHFQ